MSLSIKLRRVDGALMLELTGRLSIFEQNLRDKVRELIERGERSFIINLAGVDYLDSAGLGQLCTVYVMLRARGGGVMLAYPTERVRKLLHTTKLDTVFKLLEGEIGGREAIPPPGSGSGGAGSSFEVSSRFESAVRTPGFTLRCAPEFTDY